MTLEHKIKQVIDEVLCVPVESIRAEDQLADDLAADSLDRVELFLAVEEALHIEMDEACFDGVVTVGDLIEMVRENVSDEEAA